MTATDQQSQERKGVERKTTEMAVEAVGKSRTPLDDVALMKVVEAPVRSDVVKRGPVGVAGAGGGNSGGKGRLKAIADVTSGGSSSGKGKLKAIADVAGGGSGGGKGKLRAIADKKERPAGTDERLEDDMGVELSAGAEVL